MNKRAVEAERVVVLSMLEGSGKPHARSRTWLYERLGTRRLSLADNRRRYVGYCEMRAYKRECQAILDQA